MPPSLRHFTSPDFWTIYNSLPSRVRETADKYFAQLKVDHTHPFLHFKKIGDLWSVRAGILWFWIGSHGNYDRIIKQR